MASIAPSVYHDLICQLLQMKLWNTTNFDILLASYILPNDEEW